MPQLHTTDQPTAPRGRDTEYYMQQSHTIKRSIISQLDNCKTRNKGVSTAQQNKNQTQLIHCITAAKQSIIFCDKTKKMALISIVCVVNIDDIKII